MSYTFRYALDFPKRTDEDLILLTIDFDEDIGAIPSLVLTPECIKECNLESHFSIDSLMKLILGIKSDTYAISEEDIEEYKKVFINAFYFKKED